MENATLPRAVLFADVVGSTSLYRRVGDECAEALIRAALERAIKAAEKVDGRLIKTIGDCAMCELPDANAAAKAAIGMHEGARLPVAAGDEPVLFRVGFTVGPTVARDNDLFGDAVNIAARLCSMAKAEQILTTDSSATGLSAELRNDVRVFDHTPVKGVSESLTIVQLLWDRNDATQMFVPPSNTATFHASELVLSYAGQDVVLKNADLPYTIGREPGCDLLVPSSVASRVHARIEAHRGKFTLVDDSTNGTYVLPEGVPADAVVYLRREVFTLLGHGMFALGERPAAGGPHVLRYELA